MQNVELIRRYTLRKVNEIRIFISSLPDREEVALQKLYGTEGVQTAASIAEFVLAVLGHEPSSGLPAPKPTVDTLKAAKKVMPTRAAMEK